MQSLGGRSGRHGDLSSSGSEDMVSLEQLNRRWEWHVPTGKDLVSLLGRCLATRGPEMEQQRPDLGDRAVSCQKLFPTKLSALLLRDLPWVLLLGSV